MGGGLTQNYVLYQTSAFLSFRLHNLDEMPVEELIANVENPNHRSFKRTFLLEDGKVVYKKIQKARLQASASGHT
jgi:hypothetical protein